MKYALGIDIGGTKIALGVVSEAGLIRARTVIPTDSHLGFADAVRRIGSAARKVAQAGEQTAALAGVGVGCTGPVDPRTGVVNNPNTLPGWDRCNLVAALSAELGLPVWLENDADTAAYGEHRFGAGAGAGRFVMLTFGTGVGGAAVLGGEIYRGAGGGHPELGHLPVSHDGPPCYCGRRGCVESLASGPAMARAAAGHDFADAAAVFVAAAEDEQAQKVLSDARGAVEAAIWGVLHGFLPDRIVLGGGMVEAQPVFFLGAARTAVNRARLLDTSAVTVAPARLGNLAGLVGAARWAIDRAAEQPPQHSSSS